MSAFFAGSSGFMDIPPPCWLSSTPTLFSHWGQYLVKLVSCSQLVILEPGERLDLSRFDLAVVVSGGLYCSIEDHSGEAKHLLVNLLMRGSICSRSTLSQYGSTLTSALKSACLIIPKHAMPEFLATIPHPKELLSEMNAFAAAAHEEALGIQDRKDIERIVRVLRILSTHPASAQTSKGVELMISKGEIRHLAGVQKRSASRAFTALETAGVLRSEGYKLLYFIEDEQWPKETQ